MDEDTHAEGEEPADAPEARPSHYLRAWREYRGMNQVELAASVGTAPSVISLLESDSRPMSPKWLHRLAPVLKTRPGWIIEFDPNDVDVDLLEAWLLLEKDAKERARAIIELVARK